MCELSVFSVYQRESMPACVRLCVCVCACVHVPVCASLMNSH